MLEIASVSLVIFATFAFLFLLVAFVVVWFRERSLPPEEKDRRRQLRLGNDPDPKRARRFRYAYGFMVFAYLFVLGSIVVSSWQGAQERQAELTASAQEQTPAEQSSTEPIDTTSWQTYRNEEYGFEVRYPADWWVIDETEIVIISNISPERFRIGLVAPRSMEVSIAEGLCNAQPEFKSEASFGSAPYIRKAACIKNFQVSLISADSSTEPLTEGEKELRVDVLEQILSTFRFVE